MIVTFSCSSAAVSSLSFRGLSAPGIKARGRRSEVLAEKETSSMTHFMTSK